jgi:hypothetical protein
MRRLHRIVLLAGLVALAPVLAGCEDFDTDKLDFFHLSDKKKLPGERKELFPGGVPGVTQGIPPEYMKGNQPPADTAQTPLPGGTAAAATPPPGGQTGAPAPSTKTAVVEPAPELKPAAKPKPKPKRKAKVHKRATAQAKAQPATQNQAGDQQKLEPWPKQQKPGAAPWPAQQQQPGSSPWPSAPPPGTFSQ